VGEDWEIAGSAGKICGTTMPAHTATAPITAMTIQEERLPGTLSVDVDDIGRTILV
jgi:hypothetical protein